MTRTPWWERLADLEEERRLAERQSLPSYSTTADDGVVGGAAWVPAPGSGPALDTRAPSSANIEMLMWDGERWVPPPLIG